MDNQEINNGRPNGQRINMDEVNGPEAGKNVLDLAEDKLDEGEDEITLQLKAEAAVTGSSYLPTGHGHPRALITGASTGIGRGTALILAEAGYDLALTYRTHEDEARKIKSYIKKRFKRRCELYHLDTADDKEIKEVVAKAAKALGGIDVLVNNAGITIFEEAFEDTIESMDKLLAVNFRGAMIVLQETAKVMRDQEFGGSIINISSIHSDSVDAVDAIYGATKSAMERATKTYALQYGPQKIRVNSIAPGAILIDRTVEEGHSIDDMREDVPLGRSGLPRDIAHAVLFLGSEQSSYITGITILIDGGMALA